MIIIAAYPSDPSPTNSTHSRQQRSSHIPTVQQDLECSNIVDDDRPRDSTGAAGQIVVPHQQQQREQFRETRDQQRRADERFVRVVRYHCGDRTGKLEAQQRADWDVEGGRFDGAEGEEEEVL